MTLSNPVLQGSVSWTSWMRDTRWKCEYQHSTDWKCKVNAVLHASMHWSEKETSNKKMFGPLESNIKQYHNLGSKVA